MPAGSQGDLSVSQRAPLFMDLDGAAGATLLRRDSSAGRQPVTVAFVNNMPDAAFRETEAQFLGLLGEASSVAPILITRYWMPGVPRGRAVASLIEASYESAGSLLGRSVDAVIITGTDPLAPNLQSEAFWPLLSELVNWAKRSTTSALLSCLAAHAAIYLLDEVERTSLPQKFSGVMVNKVDHRHPLSRDLDSEVPIPHSRRNGVELSQLEAKGYQRLLTSQRDWTAVTKFSGDCLFLLLQGHPEYQRNTLLREYRRDLRLFQSGRQSTRPSTPTGYLTPIGLSMLHEVSRSSAGGSGGSTPTPGFPLTELASEVMVSWSHSAATLYRNWMEWVVNRSSSSGTPTGVANFPATVG